MFPFSSINTDPVIGVDVHVYFIAEINLDVLGTHTAQTSAQLAMAGAYSQSRGVALMNQRLAWRYR